MFLRVLLKSIVNRKVKVSIAVAAVALGSSIACALMSLTLNINDKVSRELKSYGANLLLVPETESIKVEVAGIDYTPPTASEYIDESFLPKLKELFWRHNIVGFAPHLYALVYLPAPDITLPLIGTWFDKELTLSDGEKFRTGMKHLNRWWQVEGSWANDVHDARLADSCMIGSAVAMRLSLEIGQRLDVNVNNIDQTLRMVGIIHSGGFEEEQIFVTLETAQALTGRSGKVNRAQVSALTTPEDELAKKDPKQMTPQEYDRWYCTPYISSISHQIEDAIPGVLAKPIAQITHAEENVVRKIHLLMILITFAALIASGLGVMSTMTTNVLERRSEVGLMKALGAETGKVMVLFLSESAAIGLLGGIFGYGIGILLAQILGRSVFHSTIEPSLVLAPLSFVLSIGVALLGSVIPVSNALKFEPITTLRGK